jgi:hypothetical protein
VTSSEDGETPLCDLTPLAQVERIEAYGDPLVRIEAARDAQALYEELSTRLAGIRTDAMRELAEDGWTYDRIAEHFDITRARVERIINRPCRPVAPGRNATHATYLPGASRLSPVSR